LTFLLGTLYVMAYSQVYPFIFLTNISKTWLTARIVDDLSSKYFWMGILLHSTPSCLALSNVAFFSLLWSHSPPITYTFLSLNILSTLLLFLQSLPNHQLINTLSTLSNISINSCFLSNHNPNSIFHDYPSLSTICHRNHIYSV